MLSKEKLQIVLDLYKDGYIKSETAFTLLSEPEIKMPSVVEPVYWPTLTNSIDPFSLKYPVQKEDNG